MEALAVGNVVFVRFPFSDQPQSKLRPAICLADAGRNEWVLCQITNGPYGDPQAIALDTDDFSSGGLPVRSFARPAKLFTTHSGFIAKTIGVLTKSKH